MTMNNYVKPDYEVMVFEPSEYVAACPFVPEQIIEMKFDCAGDTLFKFFRDVGNGTWSGYTSSNGEDFSAAAGNIHTNTNSSANDIEYVFAGTIRDDNHGSGKLNTAGHWVSMHSQSAASQGATLGGQAAGGNVYCDCKFDDSSAMSSAHHHITSWTTVGGSRNFS